MTEDTFISHLIELRDRLLRALVVFAVVLLALIPFSAELYDLLATPMMSVMMTGHASSETELSRSRRPPFRPMENRR